VAELDANLFFELLYIDSPTAKFINVVYFSVIVDT